MSQNKFQIVIIWIIFIDFMILSLTIESKVLLFRIE